MNLNGMTDAELVKALRTESLYRDKATLEIMDYCMEAAGRIEQLSAELARVTEERDAAVGEMASSTNKCDFCRNGLCCKLNGTAGCKFEWREIKEDE